MSSREQVTQQAIDAELARAIAAGVRCTCGSSRGTGTFAITHSAWCARSVHAPAFRAILEAAAPLIRAEQRERDAQLADDIGGRYLDGGDWSRAPRVGDFLRRAANWNRDQP